MHLTKIKNKLNKLKERKISIYRVKRGSDTYEITKQNLKFERSKYVIEKFKRFAVKYDEKGKVTKYKMKKVNRTLVEFEDIIKNLV